MAWTEDQYREHGWSRLVLRVRTTVADAYRDYARDSGQTLGAALEALMTRELTTSGRLAPPSDAEGSDETETP